MSRIQEQELNQRFGVVPMNRVALSQKWGIRLFVGVLAGSLTSQIQGFAQTFANGPTYYSIQHADDWPPLPANILGLPEIDFGGGMIGIDDLDVDYALIPKIGAISKTSRDLQYSESDAPPIPGGQGVGGTPTGRNGPQTYDFTTNLWIEITSMDGGSSAHLTLHNSAHLTLHNTVAGEFYQLEYRATLDPEGAWNLGEIVEGAANTNQTDFSPVPIDQNATRFFRAHHEDTIVSIVTSHNAIEPSAPNSDPGRTGSFAISSIAGHFVRVFLQVSGSAQSGIDYGDLPTSVTQSVGQSVKTVFVQPIEDNRMEGDETVKVMLIRTNGYLIDPSASSATLTVYDSLPTNQPVAVANLNTPVAVDYHQPSDSLIATYNYSSGEPYNFARIFATTMTNNGVVVTNVAVTNWSTIHGITDEIKLTTIRTSANGFISGEAFFSSGTGVGRLSPDGTSADLSWCTLSNSVATNALHIRGSLNGDVSGSFSGDLVVATSDSAPSPGNKGVWRVDAVGNPTLVTNINTFHLEGVITLTNDVEKWGPWAGRILSGDESAVDGSQHSRPVIYAIGSNGEFTTNDTLSLLSANVAPEDFDIIPPNQTLYGCRPDAGQIVKLSSTLLTNFVGDLVITDAGERIDPNTGLAYGDGIFVVLWDGLDFVTRRKSFGSYYHFEHVTFAPIDLPSQ